MRKQRSGAIVQLSSIGGLVGTAGWGTYNATKFAVEWTFEALAQEVAPLGDSYHSSGMSRVRSAPKSFLGAPA